MQNLMIDALEYARRALQKPRLEVAQLQLLLLIANQKEPLNMGKLAKILGVDSSFVSRNSKTFGQGSKGPQVISLTIDYTDPKCRLVNLTDQGKYILSTIEAVTNGSTPPRLPPVLDNRRKERSTKL